MVNLTPRQTAILKFLIEEYIDTATPVSSDALEKKYNLGVSPATIRNEMAVLAKKGYLKKPHVSSGRVPTPMGLKFYVQNLLETKQVPVAEEVAVKEKIWDYRQDFDRLLKEATNELARRSSTLALSLLDDGRAYWAGVANILDFPEFWDIDLTHALLSLLDDYSFWENLVSRVSSEAPVHVILGDDFGMENLEPCGFVFTRFKKDNQEGSIGVVGPGRIPYRRIIPLIDYFGRLISEIG